MIFTVSKKVKGRIAEVFRALHSLSFFSYSIFGFFGFSLKAPQNALQALNPTTLREPKVAGGNHASFLAVVLALVSVHFFNYINTFRFV